MILNLLCLCKISIYYDQNIAYRNSVDVITADRLDNGADAVGNCSQTKRNLNSVYLCIYISIR